MTQNVNFKQLGISQDEMDNLSKRKRDFLREYAENGGDDLEAMRKVAPNIKSNSLNSQKSLIMKDDTVAKILHAIDDKVHTMLKIEAPAAVQRVIDLSKSKKLRKNAPQTFLKANQDLIDRAGFKATDKVESEHTIKVVHNIPD